MLRHEADVTTIRRRRDREYHRRTGLHLRRRMRRDEPRICLDCRRRPRMFTSSLPTSSWRNVQTAFTRVDAMLAREMEAETPVSLEWYAILLMLAQSEDASMRPSDLADQIGLSRSATTRLVDRLESDGLAERRACESDRRSTFVLLTPRGEAVFMEAGRVHLPRHRRTRRITPHRRRTRPTRSATRELADRVGGEALSTLTTNTTL